MLQSLRKIDRLITSLSFFATRYEIYSFQSKFSKNILFVREFENGKIVNVTDTVTAGCEDALLYGTALTKIDGACCAVINGEFYKRYDAKHGKKAPEGAIACCEPDPVTGHHPHWVKVDNSNPNDKWFVDAFNRATSLNGKLADGTYEAIGPHFQTNPYFLAEDILVKHTDTEPVTVERNYDAIREWLKEHDVEGIVFWLNGEPVCKVKRSDFGFGWKTTKTR